jgi:mRNA-degrading endonuclease HigB of HigAB toxin-antitoxin module
MSLDSVVVRPDAAWLVRFQLTAGPIADFRSPVDASREGPFWYVKAQFGNASILKCRRAVFNVKGNDYRIVAALAYHTGLVFIKFVGTHAEYDRIAADTVERG